MPSKFTCEVCSKIFKTTQHLNQHKNRKKKCQPSSKPEQLMNMNLLTTIIETSSSSSSSNGTTNTGIGNLTNISDITSSLLTLNANTSNSDIVYKANQTLIELIIKYKIALDEIKKLENMYNGMKSNVQKLQNDIFVLKKQLYVVHKFVDEFTCLFEKENETSYVSALTEPDNNTVNTSLNLYFPEENP